VAAALPCSVDQIVAAPGSRMAAVLDYLRIVGPGQGTVLITGESGTGKEVVATAIHALSPRAPRPFVPVSCALFFDSLIESELFGHDRGAFTGALQTRPGRFERAEGGTLFLDDIDDVPLAMQVKLLRALQNRSVERLGGTRALPIDVRVVAGTKRDLRQMVREGWFREDLYYRLNVLSIELPPLRQRREDLALLMQHFLARFFGRKGQPVPPISEAVLQAFHSYDWPGNVRELENACERLAESSTCGRIGIGCVAASVLFHAPSRSAVPADRAKHVVPVEAASSRRPPLEPMLPSAASGTERRFELDNHLRRVESSLIEWALKETGGNKSRAAALLGVKRSTLGDRIERCGLDARSVSVHAR
jgi:transcriptional regulator with GAF, ATPase, and Fis domain